MHVVEHEPLDTFRELMGRQARVREHRRFHAVLLARQGKTAPEIAAVLGCARRPVQQWVSRYNRGGPAGLLEATHPGRPPRLAADRAQRLRERIDAGPRPGDGTCAFHGEDLRRILAAEFGVLLKLSAVYGLLHRLGYSRLCPRPRHPDADPAAQDAFKKTRGDASSGSRPSTRTSVWRRGSRTRPASGSRAR
jgi:transposase